MLYHSLPRAMPEGLEPLTELALDLHWTWSHAADSLWRRHGELWERTQNPWAILQNISNDELEKLAHDPDFRQDLRRAIDHRQRYLQQPAWCDQFASELGVKNIAYFSLEFGLSEALPLYAGGLGILAGDFLKTASDLALPVIGIGLLYQEGYFRQLIDANDRQIEVYPYNDPSDLPIQPVSDATGSWLKVTLELPGRTLLLRVWRANVGRINLYLLDSNDLLNGPSDRGITAKLYSGGVEMRLMQEMVLGIGGWRILEQLNLEIDVCHLNEGHAAFVVLERARRFMKKNASAFGAALWATRAGNVFTTHTPVAAGFDIYSPDLIAKYFPYFRDHLAEFDISLRDLLALGRKNPDDDAEPFNMTFLALRGCATANGVSELHGVVSRRLFSDLYPRWPEVEIPIGHVTNGVHVPSWDSAWADTLWTDACGKRRWHGDVENLTKQIQALDDNTLWEFRGAQRRDLVHYARARLARQLGQCSAPPEQINEAHRYLDPNVLTLGFARRFAEYKRPNLILHEPARLARLVLSDKRPIQIIVAGKAHPDDEMGKILIREWLDFIRRWEVRGRVVFLEDYDIALAQQLVQGVDVWINTPNRPWEACGTSGMKVLANGGLNLSELDGWWAEAYAPDLGWAIGDGREHHESGWSAIEAEQLYQVLEAEVVPAFYNRSAGGVPEQWVKRIRASISMLAPKFSSNRMLQQYLNQHYRPAADAFQRRSRNQGLLATELDAWYTNLRQRWHQVRFGTLEIKLADDYWNFYAPVYLGELKSDSIKVELYADPSGAAPRLCQQMQRQAMIPGALNAYVYRTSVRASRPSADFTPRITAYHPEARIPSEAPFILWQRE
ncbi:MAG: alpha-glucan family phosphorylase [Gammaproteobacteria bacterium]|nr:alpha-glucan family phosphorylase [Gammaproteobacteria bacterium]